MWKKHFNSGLIFLISLMVFSLLLQTGCQKEKQVNHGAGQLATFKEQEEQNKSLLGQVVQATEELEKHPDPVYLRNAIGRLDPWLQKQKISEHFVQDPQYQEIMERSTKIANLLRESDVLYKIFQGKSETKPTEKDGDKLVANLDAIQGELAGLEKIHSFTAFNNYKTLLTEFSKRLKGTKEFQFGDHVEMYQTVIGKFEIPPMFQFSNAAQAFETYSTLFKSDEQTFHPEDADYLKQSVWLRNIANWAKGTKQDDQEIVINLFDWTIKNIPLREKEVNGPNGPIPCSPWEVILTSQGNALERAIVFMELLRQNRLDSFILRPSKNVPKDFPLLVGVRLDKETYLYLPELGLPIPAKNALKFINNKLVFEKIATLTDVVKDDSILRQLDLSDKEKIPLTAKQLEDVTAFVPTNPFNMSERMRLMESEFSGEVYTVLATSWTQQKERIAALNGIKGVQHLWEGYSPLLEQIFFPLEATILVAPYLYTMKEGTSINPTIQRNKNDLQEETRKTSPLRDTVSMNSPLWIGKILYFKGKFTEENGAAHWLQQGRTSDRILRQSSNEITDHTNAYLMELQKKSAEQGKALTPEEIQKIGQQYALQLEQDIQIKIYVKTTARFYLGLVSLGAHNDKTALSHLSDVSLRNELGGQWKTGTLYLLARIYEDQGETARAIGMYKSATGSMKYGEQLRGKWLEEASKKK